MLFVFNVIRRDGLVAEFTQLDPDFVGGSPVGPAPHGSPVDFCGCKPASRAFDGLRLPKDFFHVSRQLKQFFDFFGHEGDIPATCCGSHVESQDGAGNDL